MALTENTMSLEEALAENTAALKAHTAALKAHTAAVTAQTEFMKSMAGKGGATTAAAATTKPATTKPAAKAKTMEDVRSAASAFLGVTDADQRAANKASMKSLLDHLGVDRATAISEEQIPEMLKYLDVLQKGETPDYMNEGEMV